MRELLKEAYVMLGDEVNSPFRPTLNPGTVVEWMKRVEAAFDAERKLSALLERSEHA